MFRCDDGVITVESRPGDGAPFSVCFPTVPVEEESPSAEMKNFARERIAMG
jgi:hypothetical protein